jgi:hypothetical protein
VKKRIPIVTLAILLPSCGGGSTPTPPTTQPPCIQSVIVSANGLVTAGELFGLPFSVVGTGRLDVIADWTSPASTVGVYVAQRPCAAAAFNARTCSFLIRSDSGAKPRKVSAASVTPGDYILLLTATQNESAAAQVILSSPTCAPLASGTAGASLRR